MNRLRYDKTYYKSSFTPFPQSICFSLIYDWIKVKSKESPSGYMQLTFMEKGNNLESENYKNITPLYYFYIQLLHALHIGQVQYGFIHGDLHGANLLSKRLYSSIILENNDYYEYDIILKRNTNEHSLIVNSFRIPASQVEMVPLIIDFGWSRIQVPFRNAHLITDEMGNRKYPLKIDINHKDKKKRCTRILHHSLDPELTDTITGIIKNEDLYFILKSFSDRSLRDTIIKKLFPLPIDDIQNRFISISDGDFSYDMRLQSGEILSNEKVLFSWITDTIPIYTKEFTKKLFFDQLRIFGEGSIDGTKEGEAFSYGSEEYLTKFPTIYANAVLRKVGSVFETIYFFKERIKRLFISDGILTDYFIDIEDIVNILLKEGLNWENNIYENTTSANNRVNQFIKNLFDDFIDSKLESNHDGANYQSIFYMIVYAARIFRTISMLKREYITELGNLVHLLFSMSCIEEIMPTGSDSMFDTFAKIRRETVKKKLPWTNSEVFFLQLLSDAVRRGRRDESNALNSSFVCYLMLLGSIQWNKGLAHINLGLKKRSAERSAARKITNFEMDLEVPFNVHQFNSIFSWNIISNFDDPFLILIHTLRYQVSHVYRFIGNSNKYYNFANENINYINQIADYEKRDKMLKELTVILENYYKYYDIINDDTKSILPPFFNTRPIDILKYIMSKDIQIPKIGKVLSLGKFLDFTKITDESEKSYTPIAKCIICSKMKKRMYMDKSINKTFCGVKCQEKYYYKREKW
jgi:hypothetical protein